MKFLKCLKSIGLFLLIGSVVSIAASTAFASEGETKPNIVIFIADDMGWWDSGTYGNELIQTPNMDRLAVEGVKFTQCYSAAGVCSPSRSAILTGRTPYRNGVFRHLSGNHTAHLRASEITYPELLKKVGYETCHVGKWHLLSKQQFNQPGYPQPSDQGFDYWMATQNNAEPNHRNPNNFVRNGEPVGKTKGYSAQLVAAEAIHWLEDLRDPEKPFVMSVWFNEPHSKIATDSRFQSLYKGHKNAKYMGNITQMDNGLGMVLDALDDQGVSDNTLVFFTSDNGPVVAYGGSSGVLRGYKRSDYEGGIRVPGLARWPGHIEPGTVSDVPVIGTDLFATICEIAGVDMPTDRTIDGVSMLPAFKGQAVERKTPLFWRTHVSPPEQRVAMRIGDWKIVGDEMLETFELYNIPADISEENNLAAKMPEKTEEMKAILLDLWADIVAEGPNEWWESEKQRSRFGGKLSY
jgi:arylsulfatase A-like enzyme